MRRNLLSVFLLVGWSSLAQFIPFSFVKQGVVTCSLPWGGTIGDGNTVSAFSTALPLGACSSFEETRTCTNGTLSGSFTNATCNSGCTAATVSNCDLSTRTHGSSSGICKSGFSGSCSYGCSNGSNTLASNTCVSSDPCATNPAIGTVCTGGALYLGQFDGGSYMVTPGGCTDSATPTCAGGDDTVEKSWPGSGSYNGDVAGAEHVNDRATPSSSSFRGNVNTDAITADPSISSDSAAHYCQNMTYGGHSDWYLPSKSELSFLFCKSTGTMDPGRPDDYPNCAAFGGKVSIIGGIPTHYLFKKEYWSSTESRADGDAREAWVMDFDRGRPNPETKHAAIRFKVRCIRRF